MKQVLTLACLAFFFIAHTIAQPTETFLGGTGKDLIAQIVPTPDGNFLATGAKQIGANTQVWLFKMDQAGAIIWEKTLVPPAANTDGYGHNITLLPAGDIIITGEQRGTDVFDDGTAIAIKTDAAGKEIWKRSYANISALFDAAPSGSNLMMVGWSDYTGALDGGLVLLVNGNGILQWKLPIEVSSQTKVRRIFPTPDGKFMLVGRTNAIGVGLEGIFLQKTEPDGTPIWQKSKDTGWEENYFSSTANYYNQALGAAQQADGSIWVVNPAQNGAGISLLQYSGDGDLIGQKSYNSPTLRNYPYNLVALPGNGWLIAGEASTATAPVDYQGFAMQVDSGGLEVWRQYYGAGNSTERLFASARLDNGQLLLAGTSSSPAGHGGFDGWLLRAESNGNVLPWSIEGRVVIDLNGNCQADAGEPPAAGWFVSATDTTNHLITTDQNGQFQLRTGDGLSTVSVVAPEPAGAWMFCQASQTVNSNPANPKAQLTFLVQATDGGCPRTEVSLTQPDFRRCENSTFYATVQNRGTGESGDLLLQITLDPALSVVSSSSPFTQNGQSLEFNVAPMAGLEQKTIRIEAKLACTVQLSATHSVVARLTPVECASMWDGPHFSVDGQCTGTEIRFSLKNDGQGGPAASTRFRVMADDLLATDWTDIVLPEGAPAQELNFPADGRTWRLELEQAPGFPGESHPAAAIEGCGRGENGLHSIALVNAWRFDEGAPNVAAILAPNTTGVPNKVAEATRGFGLYNFIGDSNWLEYTARVRNPLAGQAQTAEFRFVLSDNLDKQTFQAVAYNAPVQLELDNNGTLRVRMTGLQLDSGAYAMVRFRIRPLAGTPADSSQASLLIVNANAYIDGTGPYTLAPGFHNFTHSFPVTKDEYNDYPPNILRYGGRSFDFGNAMTTGPDGSVWLAGESSSFSDRTNTDALLVKTDAAGRAHWLTAIDLGDQGLNTFRGVAALPDGGCLAAGNWRNPNSTTSYLSDYVAYVARLDASGKMLWFKKFRPAGPQNGSWTNGILSTIDGQFILFGYAATAANGQDQFYVKINENGDVIWQQQQVIDGSAFQPIQAMHLADGSTVFLGSNESTVVNFRIYLEKIDAGGNILWSKGYSSLYGCTPGGIAPAAHDGFLVGGYSSRTLPSGDYATTPTFIRFSADGEGQWEKSPIIGLVNIAYGYNLIAAPGGGYFCVGEVLADSSYDSDVLLLKVDAEAEPLWWQHYGAKNTEWAEAAAISGPNQILLWGHNQSRPPLYDLQGVLVRTDLNGNLATGTSAPPATPQPRVTVFPNPAQDVAHVLYTPGPGKAFRWELRDLTGRLAGAGATAEASFSIPVGQLPAGLYFLYFPGQGVAPQRLVVCRKE